MDAGYKAGLLKEFIAATCHVWQLGSIRFEELPEMVGDEPLLEPGFPLAGPVDSRPLCIANSPAGCRQAAFISFDGPLRGIAI
jgi:hypothetical protein